MAHILIIDDEEQIRTLLRNLLEREGYRISEAGDGLEALNCQQADPADLIITDIYMPEKEGLETIDEFRRRFPEVKIIAISGGDKTGKVDFLQVAASFGAQATLPKPFDLQEIVRIVKDLLA